MKKKCINAIKLALGTAQFGLDYGITNKRGKVPEEQVGEILEIASSNKIDIIDTAIDYGTSEETLGLFDLSSFKVVSKISPLNGLEKIDLREKIEGSLERLNVSKLYGLMLHREQDATEKNSDIIFKQLLEIKDSGLVEKIGVSFYSPCIAKIVLERYSIDIIQVPANKLDNRFSDKNIFTTANMLGVETHVRSLFLQGLLTVTASNRPKQFREHQALVKFDEQAELLGLTAKELAMSYLFHHDEIFTGVVGCLNSNQLIELISIYKKLDLLQIPNLKLASEDCKLLNPSLW